MLKGKDKSLTIIDPASSWFKMVEFQVTQIEKTIGKIAKNGEIFDKTSKTIATMVNTQWFRRYPCPRQVIYANVSEFKLHFRDLCDTYGLEHKSTTIKNPHTIVILERIHHVIVGILCTAELTQ